MFPESSESEEEARYVNSKDDMDNVEGVGCPFCLESFFSDKGEKWIKCVIDGSMKHVPVPKAKKNISVTFVQNNDYDIFLLGCQLNLSSMMFFTSLNIKWSFVFVKKYTSILDTLSNIKPLQSKLTKYTIFQKYSIL